MENHHHLETKKWSPNKYDDHFLSTTLNIIEKYSDYPEFPDMEFPLLNDRHYKG